MLGSSRSAICHSFVTATGGNVRFGYKCGNGLADQRMASHRFRIRPGITDAGGAMRVRGERLRQTKRSHDIALNVGQSIRDLGGVVAARSA